MFGLVDYLESFFLLDSSQISTEEVQDTGLLLGGNGWLGSSAEKTPRHLRWLEMSRSRTEEAFSASESGITGANNTIHSMYVAQS